MTGDVLAFAGDHPFLGFCLIWLAGCLASVARSLVIRTYRALMVALRGWPPAHLDADGDWKPEPKDAG